MSSSKSGGKSSGSSSSGGGLRFLWIPGRKRHNKGHIETTSKQPVYGRQHQRHGNEQWTLGGARGHEKLLGSNDSDMLTGPDVPKAVASVAACTAVDAATDAVIVGAAAPPPQPMPVAVADYPAADGPASPTTPLIDGGGSNQSPARQTDAEASSVDSCYYGDEDGAHNTATLMIGDRATVNGVARKKLQSVLHSSASGGDRSPDTGNFSSTSLSPIDCYAPPSGTNASHTATAAAASLALALTPQSSFSNEFMLQNSDRHQLPSYGDDQLPTVPWDRLKRGDAVAGKDSVTVLYPLQPRDDGELPAVPWDRLKCIPKDLDSIDRLDDDCVDAIALGKGGKQQKKGPSDDNKGENEKTVTCLYYALQCCDCTIS